MSGITNYPKLIKRLYLHPDFSHHKLRGFPVDVANMAGESVPAAGYGSDEFESSIASEVSQSSEEGAVSVAKGSKSRTFSGMPAKSSSLATDSDMKKRLGGDTKKSTVQVQASSASIRQAVYDEWCRSKEKHLAEQQRKKTAEKVALEKTVKEEKENYKVKCEKAVEDWLTRKKEQSVKSRKRELRDKGRCSLLSTGIHTIPGLLSVHPCSMLATVDCHASLVCMCVCVCVLCVCVCVCAVVCSHCFRQ